MKRKSDLVLHGSTTQKRSKRHEKDLKTIVKNAMKEKDLEQMPLLPRVFVPQKAGQSSAKQTLCLTENESPAFIVQEYYVPPKWLTKTIFKDMIMKIVYLPRTCLDFHLLFVQTMKLRWSRNTFNIVISQMNIERVLAESDTYITTIDDWMEIRRQKSYFLKAGYSMITVLIKWGMAATKLTEIPHFIISAIVQNGGMLSEAFPMIKEFNKEHLGATLFEGGVWYNNVICTQTYLMAQESIMKKIQEDHAFRMEEMEKKIKELETMSCQVQANRPLSPNIGIHLDKPSIEEEQEINTNIKDVINNEIENIYINMQAVRGVLDRVIRVDLLEDTYRKNQGLLEIQYGIGQEFILNTIINEKSIKIKYVPDVSVVDFLKTDTRKSALDKAHHIYCFDIPRKLYVLNAFILSALIEKRKHDIEDFIKKNPEAVYEPSFKHMTKEIDLIENSVINGKSFTASMPLLYWPDEMDRMIKLLRGDANYLRFVIDPENVLEANPENGNISIQIEQMLQEIFEMSTLHTKISEAFKNNDLDQANITAEYYQNTFKRRQKSCNQSGIFIYSTGVTDGVTDYTQTAHLFEDNQTISPGLVNNFEEIFLGKPPSDNDSITSCSNDSALLGDLDELLNQDNINQEENSEDEDEAVFKPKEHILQKKGAGLNEMNRDIYSNTDPSTVINMFNDDKENLVNTNAVKSIPKHIVGQFDTMENVNMRIIHPLRLGFAMYTTLKSAFHSVQKHDITLNYNRKSCVFCGYVKLNMGIPSIPENYCRIIKSMENEDTFCSWFCEKNQTCIYCAICAMVCLIAIKFVFNPEGNFDLPSFDVIMNLSCNKTTIKNRYLFLFEDCPFIPIGRMFYEAMQFYRNIAYIITHQLKVTKPRPSDVQCELVYVHQGENTRHLIHYYDLQYANPVAPSNAKFMALLEMPKHRIFDVVETAFVLNTFYLKSMQTARLAEFPGEPEFVKAVFLPSRNKNVCMMLLDSRMLQAMQSAFTPLILTYAKIQPYFMRQCPYYPLAIRNYYKGDRNVLYFTICWVRRMLFTKKSSILGNKEASRMEGELREYEQYVAKGMLPIELAHYYRILHEFIGCMTMDEICDMFVEAFKNPETYLALIKVQFVNCTGKRKYSLMQKLKTKKIPDPKDFSACLRIVDWMQPLSSLYAFLFPMNHTYKITEEAMVDLSEVLCSNNELWVDYPIVVELLLFSLKHPIGHKLAYVKQEVNKIISYGLLWDIPYCQSLYMRTGVIGWYSWRLIHKERVLQCIMYHHGIEKKEAKKILQALPRNKIKCEWSPSEPKPHLPKFVHMNNSKWCGCAFCSRVGNDPCPWYPDLGLDRFSFKNVILAERKNKENNINKFVRLRTVSITCPRFDGPVHYEIYKLAADPRVAYYKKRNIFWGISIDSPTDPYVMPGMNNKTADIISLHTGATETEKYNLRNFITHESDFYYRPSYVFDTSQSPEVEITKKKKSLAGMYEIIRTHKRELLEKLVSEGFVTKEELFEELSFIYPIDAPRTELNQGFSYTNLRECGIEKNETANRIKLQRDIDRKLLAYIHKTMNQNLLGHQLLRHVRERYINPEDGMILPNEKRYAPFTQEQMEDNRVSHIAKMTMFFKMIESLSYMANTLPDYENGEFKPRPKEVENCFDLKTTSRAYFNVDMLSKIVEIRDDIPLALSQFDIPIAYGIIPGSIQEIKNTEKQKASTKPKASYMTQDPQKPSMMTFTSNATFVLFPSMLNDTTCPKTESVPNSSKTQYAQLNALMSASNEAIGMIIAHPPLKALKSIITKYEHIVKTYCFKLSPSYNRRLAEKNHKQKV